MPRQYEILTHHIPTSRIPSYVHLPLPVVEVSPVHPICPVLMPPPPPPALGFPNPSPRWPDAILPEALQSPATAYVLQEHTATVTATPPQPALFQEQQNVSSCDVPLPPATPSSLPTAAGAPPQAPPDRRDQHAPQRDITSANDDHGSKAPFTIKYIIKNPSSHRQPHPVNVVVNHCSIPSHHDGAFTEFHQQAHDASELAHGTSRPRQPTLVKSPTGYRHDGRGRGRRNVTGNGSRRWSKSRGPPMQSLNAAVNGCSRAAGAVLHTQEADGDVHGVIDHEQSSTATTSYGRRRWNGRDDGRSTTIRRRNWRFPTASAASAAIRATANRPLHNCPAAGNTQQQQQ
ncbi:hypothetical protein FPQ18DRAFT_308538 [Pyronema domesticum]|nr:hypothetical protein FPQ18DRAFT_308538 [Pyronema domesticum]